MDIKEAIALVTNCIENWKGVHAKEAWRTIRAELERVSTTTAPIGAYGSPTRAHEIALPGATAVATAPNKSQPDTVTPRCQKCFYVPDDPYCKGCARSTIGKTA